MALPSSPFPLLRALAAAAALACSAASPAQYPARPLHIIVPVPAGGAPDVLARVVGERLARSLGQPVIIDNKPGSNGNIAAEFTARSPADGYTLLVGQDSLFVVNPHLYARMPVDVRRDLVPVATLASAAMILSVNPSLPVNSLREFIEYARRANPPLAYASGGNGSQHHLMMEQLRLLAGIPLLHVPYKGGTPAATATAAGEVAATFAGASGAALVHAGKLRGLAVSGAKRLDAFAELPAIGEFYPDFDMSVWLGLFAPAGIPDSALALLRAEVAKALAAPQVAERLRTSGLRVLATSPEEFAAMMRRDDARFGDLVRRIGVRIQ